MRRFSNSLCAGLVAFVASTGFAVAAGDTPAAAKAGKAPAGDKCEAIYKQYPLTSKCHHVATCMEQNNKNRAARTAAGCKASKTYEY